MNWIYRFAQLNIPFNLESLEELLRNLGDDGHIDIPGQQYLWEGQGWDDLKQIRKFGQDDISLVIKYFHMMFEAIADELRVDSEEVYSWKDDKRYKIYMPEVDTENDPQQIEEQIAETALAITMSWDWDSNSHEWTSFLTHFAHTEDGSEKLFDNVFNSTELPSPEEFQKILSVLQAYEQLWDQELETHEFSSEQLRIAYENDARDPQTDPNEYNETLARITEEIMYGLIDNNNIRSPKYLVPWETLERMGYDYNSQKELDYLPPWLTQQRLQEVSEDLFHEELVNWYIEENRQMLEQDADESIYEYNREVMREKAREFAKSYGYDPFGLLAEDYDPADSTDGRRELELDEIWMLAKEMDDELGQMAKSVRDATGWAEMYIAAIKNVSVRNSYISEVFAQSLNAITTDDDRMFRGIADAAKTNPDSIPNEFNDPETRKIIDRLKKKLDTDLDESSGAISSDHVKRLQELGLAEHPFPHQYKLRPREYPERGWKNIVPSVLQPFEIAVGADASAQLPDKLIEKISPWIGSEHPNMPAIGWIGGYTDMANSVMYITKIKSSLMDRTSDMQTAEEYKEYWANQVQNIEQQIAQLPQSELTPEQLQNQRAELESEFQHAQFQIRHYQHNTPSLAEWSHLRSQVEESFQDWVAVFFNVAVREATMWAFDKLRVVSSKELLEETFSYGADKKEKMELIYDQTAQKYNATPVTAFGKQFWEIDLQSKNLRYARTNIMDNWFKRAFHKKSEQEWMQTDPATGKLIWQKHIDIFWKKFLEYMPELGESEFETGDPAEFQAQENNRFIFEHWLKEVPDELKMGEEISPEFKQQVRQYLIETHGFDPFGGDDLGGGEPDAVDPDDDVDAMSPEDLESWFSEDAVDPGAPEERHPDVDPMSTEDLESMFGEDVYDPGSPEQRRQRHGGEWWQ